MNKPFSEPKQAKPPKSGQLRLYDTPAGEQIREMLRYTAIGGPERVREELAVFARHADADELITVHPAPTPAERLESVRLAAPGH